MTLNIARHHRRSIRLRGYDYTRTGAYFVTICTQDRACFFGDVVDGVMRLSDAGQMVLETWDGLSNHYMHVITDELVVMPNHIHGIIIIQPPDTVTNASRAVGAGFKPAPTKPPVRHGLAVGAGFKPAPTKPPVRHGLAEVVRALKTFSSRRINHLYDRTGAPIWQRNYYEHIVRDEQSLNRVRQYIHNNPAQWAWDHENPMFEGSLPTIAQIEAELGAKRRER